MQAHFYILGFFGVLFIILVFPIFLRFDLYFNVLKNSGLVVFKLFGLPLFKAEVRFSKNQVNIITSKKEKTLPIDFKDEKIKFLNKLVYGMFLEILIRKLSLNFEVGKKDDAFTPAIACGVFNLICNMGLGYCYTKKGLFKTELKSTNETKEDKLSLGIQLSVVFNILLVLIVFIKTKIKVKKEKKYAYKQL